MKAYVGDLSQKKRSKKLTLNEMHPKFTAPATSEHYAVCYDTIRPVTQLLQI